ncbi:MAG: hypothetical protein RDU20_07075 [Desulfomonilaceae bacterium]|nr:hypothetical protein [Desulfomonilaceae bacterium]
MPYVAVGWFPALVAFVLVPFAVYLPNQMDYDWNLLHVLPFMILAVVSFFLLFSLALFKQTWRTRIALAFFYFGIYLALSDLLAPVPLDLIEDPSVIDKVAEPIHLTIIEFALAVGVILCAIRIPSEFVLRIGPVAVLALLMVQILTVLTSIPTRTTIAYGGLSNTATASEKYTDKGSSPRGNIYQIVFDSFRTGEFLDIVNNSNLRGVFDGFTCFENNRSNYVESKLSYPSYMTGTLFDGRSYVRWLDLATKNGAVEHLHRYGYASWFYVPYVYLAHRNARSITIRRTKVQVSTGFVRICMLRITPSFLRHEFQWIGQKAIDMLRGSLHTSRGIAVTGRKSLKFPDLSQISLLREFIEDEARRPSYDQYVYVHVLLPHIPYNWDPCCRFVGNGSYIESAQCAVKLMEGFLAKLKELGRYNDSLIVIHSDHGWERSGSEREVYPPPEIPPNVADKISVTTRGYRSPDQLMERTQALLLIKPPNAVGDLKTSPVNTQLLDIPATVTDMVGITPIPGKGKSVFSLDPRSEREIHFFFGFRRINESGRQEVFGRQVKKLDVAHVSSNDRGKIWKIYPDMTVRSGDEGLLQGLVSGLRRQRDSGKE